MTRLDPESYLDHLRTESRRFRDVLADGDPAAPVPGCPAWTAADLLWHLTEVQGFWAAIVTQRPEGPEAVPTPARPEDHPGLVAAFDRASAALASALEAADPAEQAWTWHPDPARHTVGFVLRRQAHEALIHRVDAEQSAGSQTPLDARLAADGVEECLDVMYGGCPPWGTWSPLPHHLRVDLTDVDESVWLQFGHFHGTDEDGVTHDEDDFHVVADPGIEPDAVLEATAEEMDLRLWKRGTGEQFHVAGDRTMIARLRRAIHDPIN